MTTGGALPSEMSDRRMAVAGDWHRNGAWVQEIGSRIAANAPSVSTILHAGDFGVCARSP